MSVRSGAVESTQSAYGLSISGLPTLEELAPGPSDTGTSVHIAVDSDMSALPSVHPLDDEYGVRRLADGRLLTLDRRQTQATFYGPPLAPDLLAHPYLSPVATVFSRWAGREAFHAGAFVAGGRSWAVLGPRTAGKSTLMAALAAAGYTVLSDDIVVSDGTVAYAGPRCVDLREVPPIPGLDLRIARRGTRHRLFLPGPGKPVALGGWIFLEWGDEVDLERRSAAALLSDLATRRAWRHLPSDPTTLLALTTLPAWTLRRPARWDQLPATLELLERTVTAAAQPRPLTSMTTDGGR